MNHAQRIRRAALCVAACIMVFFSCMGPTASATESIATDKRSPDELVSVAWEGRYRVGNWTGVRISTSQRENRSERTFVETRDGDGIPVRFGGKDAFNATDDQWIYVVPGSEAAPLRVLQDGKVIASQRFPILGSPSKGPSMIPRDMPWIVVFGDSLEIETIGSNKILKRDSTVVVSTPSHPSMIPDSHLGYDAIDVVILNSAGIPLLQSLHPKQRDAIVQWVHLGGRLAVMLGADSKALVDAAPWIHRLLPFEVTETVRLNPSDFETFTTSQTPLSEFQGALMPRQPGIQRLVGRTTRRVTTPLVMEYRVGFGSVVATAADLHSEPFIDWPDRMTLLTAIVGSSMMPYDTNKQTKNRATAYDDLAGQVRASLDQFSSKNSLHFSIVALILMALIALIGPLDFLLVNRWFGKPLLGWFTFPLVAIGLSGVLIWQANQTRSPVASSPSIESVLTARSGTAALETNRIEVIDIDSMSGLGRGRSIDYSYTHNAKVLDLELLTSPSFDAIATESVHHACSFGFPGKSFGGIQIALEDGRLPAYDATSGHLLTQPTARANRLITGLPLAPRSSKGIQHTFQFKTTIGSDRHVERNPTSEYLKGEFVNPLPVDVLDGYVVYGNWTYLLPTRLPAGERVAEIDSLRQKNFRFYLSRRKTIESSSEGEAWKPEATDNWERLAQILMFHDAAGGNQYTRLRNQVLDQDDLSDSLVSDRCVLVGRLKSSFTSWAPSINQQDAGGKQDAESDRSLTTDSRTLSLIRVILPVVTTKFR